MAGQYGYPVPWFPPFAGMLMPEGMLDGMIHNNGIRLGWMRGHECPCSLGSDVAGSPDPYCLQCYGRGWYWDNWTDLFTGMITFMHTSTAPDEPGVDADKTIGTTYAGEPTLTLPYTGPSIESTVWANASLFDAFVEVDAITPFNEVMRVGDTDILPYQQQLSVQNVSYWNPLTKLVVPLNPDQYVVSGAQVTLVSGYALGTAYTVEYTACPVFVAWRHAGGMPHNRPFGAGTGQVPKRFRLQNLDVWLRARGNGFLGQSASPQGLP